MYVHMVCVCVCVCVCVWYLIKHSPNSLNFLSEGERRFLRKNNIVSLDYLENCLF